MDKPVLRYLPIFRDDLFEAVTYIRDVLQNNKAANDLVDSVEKAIIERSTMLESFEPYQSVKERRHPYYRIYVNNYVIYYVVIHEEDTIMEMRRFLYNKRNRDAIV